MIQFEKTVTDNPFVDNILYYFNLKENRAEDYKYE